MFADLAFIGLIRQQAPPGIRAYLFGSESVNNSEGRVYYLPYTHIGPPRLNVLGRSATSFRLQLFGEPERKFEIQSTGDLKIWEPISTVTLGDQASEMEDTAEASRTHRFYRAVQKE